MTGYNLYLRLFVITAVVFCGIALPVMDSCAFVPEDLDRLKATKSCLGCDLRNAVLRGADLERAAMEGVNLMGANLEGANLQGAVLDDASLEKANLKKALLSGASLDHATMDDADLSGAVLDGVIWPDGRVCKKESVGVCN